MFSKSIQTVGQFPAPVPAAFSAGCERAAWAVPSKVNPRSSGPVGNGVPAVLESGVGGFIFC